jgi:membrane protease YdiL (CAAX protease family)
VLIFLCLVVLAPLFEEMLMRGALFTKIREKIKFWPTALLIASIFALMHGQFNVGVMTFILAMYSSYLREKTGAIWSSIWLHMTQNFIAFCLLFL